MITTWASVLLGVSFLFLVVKEVPLKRHSHGRRVQDLSASFLAILNSLQSESTCWQGNLLRTKNSGWQMKMRVANSIRAIQIKHSFTVELQEHFARTESANGNRRDLRSAIWSTKLRIGDWGSPLAGHPMEARKGTLRPPLSSYPCLQLMLWRWWRDTWTGGTSSRGRDSGAGGQVRALQSAMSCCISFQLGTTAIALIGSS